MEYLSGFTTYKIQSLKLADAISLVKKLKYDDTVKKSFLKSLETELFEEHKDFLSNPLLLTIMLMTYRDLAEIPSKMHIFYEQAFDTLYYRHDSSKGMYRREVQCQLAIDDFRDILACISASSYIRGQITLTNTDLLTFIRKAKQTANIPKLTPSKYIDDLVQSVCILLQDGTKFTYNHRSFQEYFTALFLVQIPTKRKIEVYRRLLSREGTDKALTLAFEMNQSMVEREFIKPMLEEIISSTDSAEDLLQSWMRSIKLERSSKSRMLKGKQKKVLGRPRYSLIDATNYWYFQMYIERMYEKSAKKYLKFGLMTKKAFIEEFGSGDHTKVIELDGKMTTEENSILERLGIMEITNRRIKFIKWLIDDIELRDQRTWDSDLETWL